MTSGGALGHNRTSQYEYCDRCGLVGDYYIIIPKLPAKLEMNTSRKCSVTGIDLYIHYYTDYLFVEVSGTCTYTSNPNSFITIKYKLYDSNNVVVDSGDIYTPDVDVGDKFVAKARIYGDSNLKSGETYRFVLVDAVG